MSPSVSILVLLVVAVISANIPWLSERFLFIFSLPHQNKKIWMRLLEWVLLYVLVGAIAMGMEQKIYGQRHAQSWEFYVVTVALFMLFALPGIIYRFQLKKLLQRGNQNK